MAGSRSAPAVATMMLDFMTFPLNRAPCPSSCLLDAAYHHPRRHARKRSFADGDAGVPDDRPPLVHFRLESGGAGPAGVEPIPPTPSCFSRSLVAGSVRAVTVSACIFRMTSGGVLAGAN